jgi:hypothetical protein
MERVGGKAKWCAFGVGAGFGCMEHAHVLRLWGVVAARVASFLAALDCFGSHMQQRRAGRCGSGGVHGGRAFRGLR